MSFVTACFVPTLQQTIYRTGVYRKALCRFFYANAFVVCFQNQFSSFIVQHSSHLLCLCYTSFCSKVKALSAVLLKTAIREIDSDSNQLKTDVIRVICRALEAKEKDVTDITVLKKGMTNRFFLFTCKGKKYIMRIPGEETDQLINRRQEAAVYQTIDGKHICDDIAYINPGNGYKITEFLEGARLCDPSNYEDVKKCMRRLRSFHEMKLKVNHEFDIFGQMEFYETLWEGATSIYKDYEKTKANVLSLKRKTMNPFKC